MPSRTRYEAVPRRSSDSLPLVHDDSGADEFKDKPILRSRRFPALIRKTRRFLSRACKPLYVSVFLAALLLWQVFFNAPYAASRAPTFEIDTKETVFIAANIIDGDLITGAWGRSLLQLVERIGKERVFVSIYGGPTAALRQLESMLECESKIVSEAEEPLSLGTIPRTTLPTGEKRVKRIAFLAEVRNKALEPLEKDKKGRKWDRVLFINDVYFEPEGALRLLWGTNLNEEGKPHYKATCAADFVTSWKYYDTFATRDAEGYSIGVPIFPWFSAEGEAATRKDVLAGKDAVRVNSCWGGMVAFDGRYFQNSTPGEWGSISAGKHGDAGNSKGSTGISTPKLPKLPLRFRSEPEPFWDSSECCLIHADIMSLPPFPDKKSEVAKTQNSKKGDKWDTGIYMNPFVRVAYDSTSFKHIWIAKRFERLFALPQRIINGFAHMPRWNYRRTEEEGQVVRDKLWISVHSDLSEAEAIKAAANLEFRDWHPHAMGKRATLGHVQSKEWWAAQGHYAAFNRTAKRGGYCGVRQLLVVKEGVLKEGEGNWDNLLSKVPPVDV